MQTPYRAVRCRAVVLATGPFQRPLVPALPPGVVQLHSRDYRNPGQVPGGAVLIVGSGGSGTQIAEELADVGLRVHLAASAHRTLPPATGAATHGGGCVRWARSKPPSPTYPKVCRHPRCCSPDRGHDMTLRDLKARGAVIHGRLRTVRDGVAEFDDDAERIAAAADAASAQFVRSVDAFIDRYQMDVPHPRPRRHQNLPGNLLSAARRNRPAALRGGHRHLHRIPVRPVLDPRATPQRPRLPTATTRGDTVCRLVRARTALDAHRKNPGCCSESAMTPNTSPTP